MNTSRNQLERLLRGAAEARRMAAAAPIECPRAATLLARLQDRDSISAEVFLIFRRALEVACILLIATYLIAAHEIREHQAGVMNLAGVAQFQVADAFVP